MVVFLSAGQTETVAEKLIEGGYPADTPAAVIYKASWEDEKIVAGTLADIGKKAKEAGISRTALIAVGGFLGNTYQLSRLYDRHFSHGFRQGTDGDGQLQEGSRVKE